MEHTDFDGISSDIGKDSFYLAFQNFYRNSMYGADSQSVLHGYGCDCGRSVAAACRDGLDVSLYSCAAARVAAGNSENFIVLFHDSLIFIGLVPELEFESDGFDECRCH